MQKMSATSDPPPPVFDFDPSNHDLHLPSGLDIRAAAAALARWVDANLADEKFIIARTAAVCGSREDFHDLCRMTGEPLGDAIVQNAEGARVVEVYDRRIGRIADGVRYHQSREGGDIHTDSVNEPDPMTYLILGCVAPAATGGETILIRADAVHAALQDTPAALETLSRPFWFEGRGMDAEPQLFEMPILTVTGGRPRFQYLRSYIESAHARAEAPLTAAQVAAMDALDAVLDRPSLQHRRTLQAGDIMMTLDTEVFHGRTAFTDPEDAGAEDAWSDRRTMVRLWIR